MRPKNYSLGGPHKVCPSPQHHDFMMVQGHLSLSSKIWNSSNFVLRNRRWPTTFHTITARYANRWFYKWPVWSTSSSILLVRHLWCWRSPPKTRTWRIKNVYRIHRATNADKPTDSIRWTGSVWQITGRSPRLHGHYITEHFRGI